MRQNEDYPMDPTLLAAELRARMSKLKRRLREQADPGDLTPSQTAVIIRLESVDSATVAELAQWEGVRHQSMRNTVASLSSMGMIESSSDPEDGRKTLLSLSEGCRRILSEGRAARNDWLSGAIAGKLTGEEQALLGKAMKLIKRLTDT